MAQSKYTTEEQIEAMRKEILQEKQRMAGVSTGTGKGPGGPLTYAVKAAKIGGWVIFLGVVLLLVGAIISINVTKSKGQVPNILGFQLFEVESGSMEPTLQVGAVIVSRRPHHPESLKVNDIVTFRTLSGAVVTHRIIEVVTDQDGSKAYRTKGDNPKNSPDQELVTPDRVIGVFMAKVPLT